MREYTHTDTQKQKEHKTVSQETYFITYSSINQLNNYGQVSFCLSNEKVR